MAKSISYNQLENTTVLLRLAYQTGFDSNGDATYVPAMVQVTTDSIGSDGTTRTVSAISTVGQETTTEPSNVDLYNLLNSAQAGPALAAVVKTAIQDAINEDVSA